MEEQKVRRRRRRRRTSVGWEATSWLMLIVLGVKKSYHWVMLALLIGLILGIGFALPFFA